MEQAPLINRVAQSGLVTLDLEKFFPEGEIMPFDLKDHLFHGLLLKEKDFREAMAGIDWTTYQGKNLAVFCSTDAIVPVWAYQLIAVLAAPFVRNITFGTPDEFIRIHYYETLSALDISEFEGQRVVVKGCSDRPVPAAAYMEIARRLQPVVKSLMYGEPCSTVPLYKRS